MRTHCSTAVSRCTIIARAISSDQTDSCHCACLCASWLLVHSLLYRSRALLSQSFVSFLAARAAASTVLVSAQSEFWTQTTNCTLHLLDSANHSCAPLTQTSGTLELGKFYKSVFARVISSDQGSSFHLACFYATGSSD